MRALCKSGPDDILYKYNSSKPFIDNGKLSKYVVYVWTKLYRTDFIKRVFANLKDDYINLAEDVFTNYYILCSLHSYIVIDNTNTYNYYLIYDSVSHNNDFIKKGLESLRMVKNKLLSNEVNNTSKRVNKYMRNVISRGIKDCSRIEITRLFNS